MHYPIIIHKDPDTDYGVTVPDLPGCFTAGKTMNEAFNQAIEAIECHLEALLLDSEPLPTPQSIEYHQHNPDYQDGTWALVTVNLTKISGQTKRVNITLPERILTLMDKYALESGQTRSGLIAEASIAYIASQQE